MKSLFEALYPYEGIAPPLLRLRVRASLAWRWAAVGIIGYIRGLHLLLLILAFRVRLSRNLERIGRSATDICETLGPTYIKLGQLLSSRQDLLPVEITNSLGRLRENVKAEPEHLVRQTVAQALHSPFEAVFSEFDWQPVAAGSIAQVHLARLHDGRRVAVKIRRPNVAERMEADLHLLHAVAASVARVPLLRHVPIVEVVDEIGVSLRQQLCFRLEADRHERFQSIFCDDERVRIPKLVKDLCSDTVLVMEVIDGLHERAAGTELEEAVRTGLHALYKMIFVHGLVHADMHAGNVFFRAGSQLVMLDFGLAAALNARQVLDFAEFFAGLAFNDGARCARILISTARGHAPRFERDAFEQRIVALVNDWSAKTADEFEVSSFVTQLFDAQRRHGLRGSTEFMTTIVSLLVYEGLVKELYPGLDFQAEARPYVIRALMGTVGNR